MINLIKDGDMFTVPADVLINPINRQGIKRKGLAKTFAKRLYEAQWYFDMLVPLPMEVGHIHIALDEGHWGINGITYEVVNDDDDYVGFNVCYFPVKHLYADKTADPALIRLNLELFCDNYAKRYSKDCIVNMPYLGCADEGGLSFDAFLKPLVYELCESLSCTINLFEPKK